MHSQPVPSAPSAQLQQSGKQLPEHDDCFAVRQAARHLSQLYERHLSAAGLTPTQFSILGMLGRGPSLTMAELARALVMERTTLVRALRPLLRSGLVADAGIPRRRQLTLTPGGHARLGVAGVYWRAAQDEFERRFGPQRAAWLRRELFRVTRAV
ncbi:MarR family winged helix-turn-helix transcriptional regulator [Paraburkholderia sp. J12]|uniref:MarR family winged helix-turn-helix transcriptional regulator n=1 Tax=Paraburkholderia sp. J12 TaxID=2805432 RepID=UPI002ABDC743|nr:MarR family transcriptional regulator [Paraburkholderia sp. J12]